MLQISSLLLSPSRAVTVLAKSSGQVGIAARHSLVADLKFRTFCRDIYGRLVLADVLESFADV